MAAFVAAVPRLSAHQYNQLLAAADHSSFHSPPLAAARRVFAHMLQAAAPPSEAPMMQISPAPIPIFAAFQVKTTSPRKYFVQPNASIVQPWDSCTIMITLQAQKDYPPYMQCKDKFLIQSTKVAANTEMDEIPPDTFNKEADKVIEEMKLKVVYTLPSCGGSDDSSVSFLGSRSFKAASDDLMMLKNASLEEAVRRLHNVPQYHQEVLT